MFFVQPKRQFFFDQTKLFMQVVLCNDHYKSCHVPIQMLLYFFILCSFLVLEKLLCTVASQNE